MKILYVGLIFLMQSPMLFISSCAKDDGQSELIAKGEIIFKSTCKVCHAQGINGAPIVGNSKMWGERIKQGIPTLVEHATNGFNLMPAKGGNTELTSEEISAAVTYMVEQVKSK